MKSDLTVLVFIGAISATQLNTLRQTRRQGDKKWDSETEKNTDVPTYEADIPAGYGGTAAASNETNSTAGANSTATAAKLAQMRRRTSVRRGLKSNQEKLYRLMQGSSWGAFHEEDTADYWKEKMDTHSNDSEYGDATPEGYGYIADLQTKSHNMVRTLPENWGKIQASLDDHRDVIHDMWSDHADGEQYAEDAPSGIGEISFEVQLKQQTSPENWGNLDMGMDDHRDAIHDSYNDHIDEDAEQVYKDDYPSEMSDVITYDLQLKQIINRDYNNVLLTTATLPENWGNLEFGQEEHRQDIHDSLNDHAEEQDYKDDAPVGIDQEYKVQLKAETLPENWGNLEFGKDEHRQAIHDSLDDHAEEDDYKDDAPTGIDQEYDVQLKAQTAPENWGNLEFGQQEHRDYIKDSIDDHAEEEDYKDDAPVGIDQTYELQLKNMETAKADSKKWGAIAFEDTPEYFYGKMHKGTNPSQYTFDIPVDYEDVVRDAEPYENASLVQRGRY